MKTVSFILSFALLFIFQQCTEEEVKPLQKVQFSFSTKSEADGRTEQVSLPSGATLILSVSTRDGRPVFTSKEIRILNMNGSLITEAIALHPGAYQIIDFLVIDDASQVLFASPKQGAKLARLVENPLPYSFHVARNKVTNIVMDVVDVRHSNPEVVGYVSFNLNLIFPWRLSVFIEQNGELIPASADVIIEDENGIIQKFFVNARENLLSFKGDPDKEYVLTIIKEGYKVFTQSFSYHELLQQIGDGSLRIVLVENDKFFLTPSGDAEFTLTLEGSGSIKVNWGDGNFRIIEFTSTQDDVTSFYQLLHDYADQSNTITITGDVDQIIEFVGVSSFTFVDVEDLSSLQNIVLENAMMATLDLSENSGLTGFSFINDTIENLTLPQSHQITSVMIECSQPDWESNHLLDYIVENVYRNTTNHNLMEGAIILFNAGPVSGTSSGYLQELESAYSWYVAVE